MSVREALIRCMPGLEAASIAASSLGLYCMASIAERFPSEMCPKYLQVLAMQCTPRLQAVNHVGLLAWCCRLIRPSI